VCFLALAGAVRAQSSESTASQHVENGISISQLIASVHKKTGKKFVVDPRVHGEVEVLEKDVANIGYDDLLTILQVYGFVAVESGGWVEVVPNANARQGGGPVISGKDKRPDAEIVTTVLGAKNIPVVQLVPILRPMIPQYGHLAALPCVNKMILVDTFANVRRLEAVIESLDVGEPYKPEKCEVRPAPEH
jgi:general secretion pathway protein D